MDSLFHKFANFEFHCGQRTVEQYAEGKSNSFVYTAFSGDTLSTTESYEHE